MSSVQIKDKAENTAPAGNEWLFTQDPADPFTVKKMSLLTIGTYVDTLGGNVVNTKYTAVDYTILDDDGYRRIEVDTTTSAVTVTLPLMANNTGRRIEIALVGNDVSLNPVTITPDATDANKLANSGLASMTLLEPGQSVILQQSDNSDRWEVVSQGIATYGSAPIYACRAWVNFDASGTVAIRASGNVSSITDNEVGNYTVNFTTPMPDTNYSIVGIVNIANAKGGAHSSLVLTEGLAAPNTYVLKTTSAITVFTIDNDGNIMFDAYSANVSIFR